MSNAIWILFTNIRSWRIPLKAVSVVFLASWLTFRFLELIMSIFGREAVITEALILIILQGQECQSLKILRTCTSCRQRWHLLVLRRLVRLQEHSLSPLQLCDPSFSIPTSRPEIPSYQKRCYFSSCLSHQAEITLVAQELLWMAEYLLGSCIVLLFGQHLPFD